MQQYLQKYSILVLLYCILIASTCEDKLNDIGPNAVPFSKKDQEVLGDIITDAILKDTTTYTILPNEPPYDETLYWYIEALYKQAYASLRADKDSVIEDRWTLSRDWQIYLLLDAQANAFIVPGGHLFITTGLLKSLTREYELYYLFAFEASLMDQGHVLTRLSSEYSELPLYNLVNGNLPANEVTATIIAEEISTLEYDEYITSEVDKVAVAHICESSLYDMTGIISIESNIPTADWLKFKPSYGGRSKTVTDISASLNCGNMQTNGSYTDYVSSQLP